MSEQLESMQADLAPPPTTSDLSAFAANVEMVAEFVVESREHLAAVEDRLLLVEKDASDLESINAIFRAIHTIKGLAGFLEFQAIQDVAHEMETLLDHARCRRLTMTPSLVDTLLKGIDYVRVQVDGIHSHLAGGPAPLSISSAALMLQIRDIAETATAPRTDGEPRDEGSKDPGPSSAAVEEAHVSPPPAPGEARPTPSATTSQADDASLRIETSKLDHLMNMVGELVIANTIVSHNPHIATIQDGRLVADLALLSRITAEVQKVTTSIRMVPVGNQFQKTARLVRDLSRQLGKQIGMVTSGEDTEIDKAIAEALADPLMHMVRNSIDHGIETPEERTLSGKDPVARIRLSAYHQSAQIVVEISDDGRGLDRDRILQKATERGIVEPRKQLSDAETFQLIFEPGFSTANQVTGISGRGVGMDVVRRQVQKLRGRIDIHSEAGVGTTFFLRLPLTLAIIEGLVVALGEARFVLPLYSVVEMFCPSDSQVRRSGRNAEWVTLRGVELPVVRLHHRFGIDSHPRDLSEGVIIVTEAEGNRCCLWVDELIGKQDLVIKSLGETFKNSTSLMGCAILSDGRVGLILDVNGIMQS